MDANAPYLPPSEPSDNPVQQKKKARKTIFLWLLLIVMFVAIYQLFSAPPSSHPHRVALPTCAPPETSWWSSLVGFVPVVALAGLFIWFLRRQLSGGNKLNLKLEPGLFAIADGDLGRAVDVFAAVAHEYRKATGYAGVAKLSLATAYMYQGQLHKAIETTVEVERSPGLMFGSELRAIAASSLATLHALRGDVDAATRWCDDARKRLARGTNRSYSAASLRLAEIFTLARSGKLDETARALDRDRGRLENALTATTLRRAWLLRAFAASSDGARGSVEPWLTMARSGRKGELAWIGAEWPELAAFIAAHDL